MNDRTHQTRGARTGLAALAAGLVATALVLACVGASGAEAKTGKDSKAQVAKAAKVANKNNKTDRKPAKPPKAYPVDGLLDAIESKARKQIKVSKKALKVAKPSLRASVSTAAAATAVNGVDEGPGLTGSVGAKALILYDTTSEFGFLGELYAMVTANLASHFGSWRVQPVSQYQAGQMGQYTATIYIGSTYDEPLPAAFLDDVYNGTKPVVWIYNNIWQLTNRQTGFAGKYGWMWSQYHLGQVDEVRYKGVSLKRNGALNQAGIMDYSTVDTTKVKVLATAVKADGTSFPWAVRSGNLTYIGENPYVYTGEKDRTMIFSDLLFDALDPAAGERHRALVRLEDIHPNYDPAQFKAAVDYLYAAGVPFSFGFSPVYKDPYGVENNGQNTTVRLRDRRADQIRALIPYAQARGGVMLYHGYTHQYETLKNPYNGVTGDDFEFYRAIENADHTLTFQGPVPADSPTWFLGRVDAGLDEFNRAGVSRPQIFEFPHYAASHVDYTTLTQRYTTRYERALYFKGHLSGGAIDYSRVIGQMFPYVVKDVYGSVVLPENVGNYEPEPFFQYPIWLVSDILEAADMNKVVRDGFASFYYHPFWGTDALKRIVEGLRQRGYTFVSPDALRNGDTPPPRTAIAPENTAPPSITGTVAEGQTLTAEEGTWSGSPTQYSYQWHICDAAWFGCVNAEGATQKTYVPKPWDVGHMVRVTVTATNSAGSTAATSPEVGPVAQGSGTAPQNTALPTISGTAAVGQTLSLSNGTWSGSTPMSYNYQWIRCDSSGFNCVIVEGATNNTYVLSSSDQGHTLRGWVSATNSYGSGFAESAPSAVVGGGTPPPTAPENTSPPTISGSAEEGRTLTAEEGTWSGSPTSYSYRWRRCDSQGAACSDVSGATQKTYTLEAADVGKTMRVIVTATNAAGSTAATSAQTAVVQAAPQTGEAPTNTSPPTISGTARVGQALTATSGTWSGDEPIGYSYQWLRCNRQGNDCAVVSEATGTSYTLTSADRNRTMRVRVTAQNAYGQAVATSAQTEVVGR